MFVESHIEMTLTCHPLPKVLRRWPKPSPAHASEGSAVLTGLRLGRVGRDARVPYLRF